MNVASVAAINSTIVRPRAALLSLLRAYFGIASRLLPDLARRQAERFFTTPPHYASRRLHPVDARRETVTTGNYNLAMWQTGKPSAPAVLLAHGWGGRSVQMGNFVAPLLAAGFRVVGYDQPGHGESGNGPVAMPDLVRAIEALASTHGPFVAAIGHSLGAAALGVALRRGLQLGRVVFVSPPASMGEHAHNFARLLGITPQVREAMRRQLENRYGIRFEELDRIEELRNLSVSALFIHDRADAEVPFEHARRLASSMPGARLVKTHDLGHHRILRDPGVVGTAVEFIACRNDDLPTELPVLPLPAPLY